MLSTILHAIASAAVWAVRGFAASLGIVAGILAAAGVVVGVVAWHDRRADARRVSPVAPLPKGGSADRHPADESYSRMRRALDAIDHVAPLAPTDVNRILRAPTVPDVVEGGR